MRAHNLRNCFQIAIVGGNGFIGRALVYRLSAFANLKIFSIDNSSGIPIDTSHSKAIIQQIHMDISAPNNMEMFLRSNPVDVIVYAAGCENPTDGVSPTTQNELLALIGLQHTLSNIGRMSLEENEERPYVMYLSSYSVYGPSKNNRLLTEESKEFPSNHAGMGKLLGEDLVRRLCAKQNSPFCILRLAEVYGKKHYSELARRVYWPGYLHYYTDKIVKHEKEIEVWSPNTKIDLVPINYVTKVMMEFIKNRTTGVFNVGSGESIQVSDLVQKIAVSYGDIKSNLLPSKRLETDNMLVAVNKLQALVPYEKEKYNLDDFIKENIRVRRFEIAKQMAIEDVFCEPLTIDTTAPKAEEAYRARRLRRRMAYSKIKQIAGEEFFNIKIGKLQERTEELLSLPPPQVSPEVFKLTTDAAHRRASLIEQENEKLEFKEVLTVGLNKEFDETQKLLISPSPIKELPKPTRKRRKKKE